MQSPDNDSAAQRMSAFAMADWMFGLYIAAATAVMMPAFVKGFPAGFDAVRHYRWTYQFAEALRDGGLFPRRLPTANNRQGSPVALYYPPLPYYVASAFNLFVNTLQVMALSCWLSLVLSGFSMYTFAKSVLPGARSLVAALLYIIIPYHVYDFYQGTAVSEFWTFAWILWPLLSIFHIQAGSSIQPIFYLAIG